MIAVLGASGLLGSTLCNLLLSKNINFVKFSRQRNGFEKINLNNKKDIINKLNNCKPKIIINCTGLTDVDKCNVDFSKAYAQNSLSVKNLVWAIDKLKINSYLIHISTDQVYNNKFLFKKNSEVKLNLNNNYSITKYLGEKNLESYKNSITLRTNFFGKSASKYKISFTDYILSNLNKNKSIRMPYNVIFNPINIDFLSEIILKICKLKLKGTYNLGSVNSISKYDFAVMLAIKFNLDKKLIKKYKSNYKINKRPTGTFMSTKKIAKYIKLPTILKSISSLKNDIK